MPWSVPEGAASSAHLSPPQLAQLDDHLLGALQFVSLCTCQAHSDQCRTRCDAWVHGPGCCTQACRRRPGCCGGASPPRAAAALPHAPSRRRAQRRPPPRPGPTAPAPKRGAAPCPSARSWGAARRCCPRPRAASGRAATPLETSLGERDGEAATRRGAAASKRRQCCGSGRSPGATLRHIVRTKRLRSGRPPLACWRISRDAGRGTGCSGGFGGRRRRGRRLTRGADGAFTCADAGLGRGGSRRLGREGQRGARGAEHVRRNGRNDALARAAPPPRRRTRSLILHLVLVPACAQRGSDSLRRKRMAVPLRRANFVKQLFARVAGRSSTRAGSRLATPGG